MAKSIENMQHPEADRVPRRQQVTYQEHTHTISSRSSYSDWTPLGLFATISTVVPLYRPEGGFVLPKAHNPRGDIKLYIRGVDTSLPLHHFFVTLGSGPLEYTIERQPGDPESMPGHPFFQQSGTGCEDRDEAVEGAYPPSAISDNAMDSPFVPDQIMVVVLDWRGPATGYGCGFDVAEVIVELTYKTDSSTLEPEPLDDPLDLWDEDVCSNVVFLPAIPRRDHDELGKQPRRIGFLEDRGTLVPIPGGHFIPEGFMELFSAHKTRMVDEKPAFTDVATHAASSIWTTLTSDPEGVTLLSIEGIPMIPAAGNIRGNIIVRVSGIDVSYAQPHHHFFVRFGAGDTDDSYDIATDSDHPEFDFFPFFYRYTEERFCGNLEQLLESAYPPSAIFDNVTENEEGSWNLTMALKWQGPGGYYGDCLPQNARAQIELVYQVFEGPETPTEVCKHSYASVVIGSDGFARGLFCSRHDYIQVQRNQENHWAHPFVNRGTADLSEDEDGQRDFSVSRRVPPGMCAFIGAYHAPRWTELSYYSQRQVCREEL